jgi:hypothetical protein
MPVAAVVMGGTALCPSRMPVATMAMDETNLAPTLFEEQGRVVALQRKHEALAECIASMRPRINRSPSPPRLLHLALNRYY